MCWKGEKVTVKPRSVVQLEVKKKKKHYCPTFHLIVLRSERLPCGVVCSLLALSKQRELCKSTSHAVWRNSQSLTMQQLPTRLCLLILQRRPSACLQWGHLHNHPLGDCATIVAFVFDIQSVASFSPLVSQPWQCCFWIQEKVRRELKELPCKFFRAKLSREQTRFPFLDGFFNGFPVIKSQSLFFFWNWGAVFTTVT